MCHSSAKELLAYQSCLEGTMSSISLTLNRPAAQRMTASSLPGPISHSIGKTVVQPTAHELHFPTSCHVTSTDSFPNFSAGDVTIRTYLTEPHKQWQLHSDILTRHSTWFARSIQEQRASATERCEYTIDILDEQVRLTPRTAKEELDVTSGRSDGTRLNTFSIKIESEIEDTMREAAIRTYDQVLGSFYSIPPNITTTNITRATFEAEELVRVATNLGCTHLISPHIGNALLQYRQLLYKAIFRDPTRYLLLSIALENDFIYTESLIHLVGAYPHRPGPTCHTFLAEEIQRLIVKKSEALDTEVLEVERQLLLLTITRTERKVPFRCDVNSEFDTWFVVQLFRDTLTNALRQHDALEPSIKRGEFFRKIRAGGSRYMVYEEVRRMMQRVMPSAVDTLDEDLGLLKEFASRFVENLARNELSLDVEENKVGWLTCVKIEREDIPWRAGAQRDV
ncbi:hypothetical protein C7974DRAFT_377795 [Boeremia exigua]|uniref:uncharacterized protein n=1 Tax=Boeremia exigua TaxID=749465 RepID=UPI001E8D1323|nr:uncharacterized protein C7974DRAFT_377795 [Boeremia exigua]KAH6622197.1 hypothetical protein C7974DRAFT_377795 [Boeremia exigua]